MIRRIQIDVVFGHFNQRFPLMVFVHDCIDVELAVVSYDVHSVRKIENEMEPVAELPCIRCEVSLCFGEHEIDLAISTVTHEPEHFRTLVCFFISRDVYVDIHKSAVAKAAKPSLVDAAVERLYIMVPLSRPLSQNLS